MTERDLDRTDASILREIVRTQARIIETLKRELDRQAEGRRKCEGEWIGIRKKIDLLSLHRSRLRGMVESRPK